MKNINILKNNIKINYSNKINKIEEMIYLNISESEREKTIDMNVLKITETTINELIKTDLEIRGGSDVWLTKNLDSFYQIKLDHINIDENLSLKVLPRTKDYSLRLKIINTNIIISTLHRLVFFFSQSEVKVFVVTIFEVYPFRRLFNSQTLIFCK